MRLGAGVAVVLIAAACIEPAPVAGFGGFQPVDHVVVYAGSMRNLVEVGDTIRIDAQAFNINGNGVYVGGLSNVSFAVSDPETVRLESLAWSLPAIPSIRARGIRPDVVTITARVSGVSGSDTLRVIPAIQSLTLRPNPATVSLGDSVQLNVVATDTNGDSNTTVRPFVTIDNPLGIVSYSDWNQFKGRAVGTAGVRVAVGRMTAVGTINVVPRPP